MKTKIKQFILIYLVLCGIVFIVFVTLLSRGDRSLLDGVSFFFEIAMSRSFLIAFHIGFLLCYILFLCTKYFIRVYRTNGKKTFLKQLAYRFVLPVLLIFVGYNTLVYANSRERNSYQWNTNFMNKSGKVNNLYELDKKHRGMSVFGWSEDNTEAINSLIRANIEWVAVIPFMYQKGEKTKLVNTPENPKSYSKRDSNFIKAIHDLHLRGIRVHLKPHLWMSDGWRSNITLDSKKEWDDWFDSYRANILRYARIAEETKVELFCVGTELKTSIKKQPERWNSLLDEIRQMYHGELTYAANWHDEYEHVSFWNKLDYIGIQAYFPLTKEKYPCLESIEKGWKKPLIALKAIHEKYNKPILFTEVGYKSEADATIKPWEWSPFLSSLTKKKSAQTQQLAYEALLRQTWHEPWFAGIYIWQWDTRTTEDSAATNLDFSPRFKPAENVMAKWFGKN